VYRVPVRLVRIVALEGDALKFVDPSDPEHEESLPLDPGYHSMAAALPPHSLCKATVHNGTIIALEPTLVRGPGSGIHEPV
jgi:hypothetical protein